MIPQADTRTFRVPQRSFLTPKKTNKFPIFIPRTAFDALEAIQKKSYYWLVSEGVSTRAAQQKGHSDAVRTYHPAAKALGELIHWVIWGKNIF